MTNSNDVCLLDSTMNHHWFCWLLRIVLCLSYLDLLWWFSLLCRVCKHVWWPYYPCQGMLCKVFFSFSESRYMFKHFLASSLAFASTCVSFTVSNYYSWDLSGGLNLLRNRLWKCHFLELYHTLHWQFVRFALYLLFCGVFIAACPLLGLGKIFLWV